MKYIDRFFSVLYYKVSLPYLKKLPSNHKKPYNLMVEAYNYLIFYYSLEI